MVFVTGKWPPLGVVRYGMESVIWEASVIGKCPPLGGVRYLEMSVIGRSLLFGGFRYREESSFGRYLPLEVNFCFRKVLYGEFMIA